MRSNFNDDLAKSTITKTFWSCFRSASKSSRIPEKMSLDCVIRNNPEDIANDPFFDFTFNETSIFNLLKQTNPNKSHGPDNIGGYLLKKLRSLYILPSRNHF